MNKSLEGRMDGREKVKKKWIHRFMCDISKTGQISI